MFPVLGAELDQGTAISLLPSIITGGLGLIILLFQWSLKRNLESADARAEKVEKAIEGMRSEISAMNNNMQATTARIDTKSAVLERDMGFLQGTFSKLETRIDELAKFWRGEHDKLESRIDRPSR